LIYHIETFREGSGYVSPYEREEKPRALLNRVRDLMGVHPQGAETVDLCFLLLRRAIEVIVDQVILQGARTLFDPEAQNVAWKKLKRLRSVEPELVDSLHDLHVGISRIGGLHATGEFHLFCPITEDVAFYHEEIERTLAQLDGSEEPKAQPVTGRQPEDENASVVGRAVEPTTTNGDKISAAP
jgi:hypothetical protein